jgi:hypothetical protein
VRPPSQSDSRVATRWHFTVPVPSLLRGDRFEGRMQDGTITTESSHGRVGSVGRTPAGCHFGLGSGHYVKTSNRSRNICNGPLTPVTSTHICNGCCLAPVTYKRARTTLGWPPQCPLPMWTSGNGLLKCPLHKFFVTDVKRVHYKC